jgi:hypothetical protein
VPAWDCGQRLKRALTSGLHSSAKPGAAYPFGGYPGWAVGQLLAWAKWVACGLRSLFFVLLFFLFYFFLFVSNLVQNKFKSIQTSFQEFSKAQGKNQDSKKTLLII